MKLKLNCIKKIANIYLAEGSIISSIILDRANKLMLILIQ